MRWGDGVDHDERLRVLRELRELDLDSDEFEEAMLVLAEALGELDSRAAERQLTKLRAQLRLVEPPDAGGG
jgi:hypothetical protein